VDPAGSLVSTGGFAADAGTYYVVLASGADRDSTAEMDVCGNGITILGRAEGVSGFVAGEREFVGTMNAAVGTPRAFAQVGGSSVAADQHRARAAASAEVIATSTVALFGAFATTGNYRSRIAYDGPSGSRDGADAYLFSGEPPGPYRFREELAIGAGSTATWAWGVDVTLP
jgi:hypothetical protein